MTIEVNETHDPARRSWLASANAEGTDFPIQNLPFGLFRENGRVRGGVALGDQIIDLGALLDAGLIDGPPAEAGRAARGESLSPLLDCDPVSVSALRKGLSDLFSEDHAGDRDRLAAALVPMSAAGFLRARQGAGGACGASSVACGDRG